MRLIDLDEIEKDRRWHEGISYDLSREVVYDAEIVDAEPVRHGYWILDDADMNSYECSVCEAEYILLEGTPEDNHYYYCPNCGALLDRINVEKLLNGKHITVEYDEEV